jgi:pseudaminic acid cytidylyltransferase
MSKIAIIPARAGSKRIPKKNIKLFGGRPMISYSLGAALDSQLFDKIHVSTDCSEIAEICDDLGFPVDFLRPTFLSDDHTPIMPVLKWTLEKYESLSTSFDQVALIMPCSPFIEAADLRLANKIMEVNGGGTPVMSVAKYPAPIQWAFLRDEHAGELKSLYPEMLKVRSQDIPASYYDTGSFMFFSEHHITNGFIADCEPSFLGYEIDRLKAIDIDDESDWDFAQAIMTSKQINQKSDSS